MRLLPPPGSYHWRWLGPMAAVLLHPSVSGREAMIRCQQQARFPSRCCGKAQQHAEGSTAGMRCLAGCSTPTPQPVDASSPASASLRVLRVSRRRVLLLPHASACAFIVLLPCGRRNQLAHRGGKPTGVWGRTRRLDTLSCTYCAARCMRRRMHAAADGLHTAKRQCGIDRKGAASNFESS